MPGRWIALCVALVWASACESAPPTVPNERPPAAAARQQATAREPDAPPAPEATAEPAGGGRYEPPDGDGWGRAGALRFLEQVHGGAAPDARLPMVVMLHGLGDRPRHEWLEGLSVPARTILPQAPDPYHGGFAWFPYRAHDDDPAAMAKGISRATDLLAESIGILLRERPTVGKPIVSGFSQGGMLSYALALRHDVPVSLALPVAGMLPRPLWPHTRGEGPPIRALHGTSDAIVPHGAAQALVEHLSELGYDAQLELFEGAGHSIPPPVASRMTEILVTAIQRAAQAEDP